MAATAPEPNTLHVLALEVLFGYVAAVAAITVVCRWRPIGIYARGVTLLVVVPIVVMAPFLVVALAIAPGQWPKAVALVCGGGLAARWPGRRIYRARRPLRYAGRVRRWRRPIDYAQGIGLYLMFAYAFAAAESQAPSGVAAKALATICYFLMSQLTTAMLFRIVNHSLQHDYGLGVRAHYTLAALPLIGATAIGIAVGAGFGGPLGGLILLAAARRYTELRPAGPLTILAELRRELGRRRAASAGAVDR